MLVVEVATMEGVEVELVGEGLLLLWDYFGELGVGGPNPWILGFEIYFRFELLSLKYCKLKKPKVALNCTKN